MKKIFSTFTFISFISFVIFSCCLLSVVKEGVHEQMTMCEHHQSENDAAHSPVDGDCTCPELLVRLNEFDLEDILSQHFVYVGYSDVQEYSYFQVNDTLDFTNTDPPYQNIPLYIKYSILRV